MSEARFEGGRIFTTALFRFPGASVESLRRALLDGPWTWWRGGRVEKWTKRPDGTVWFRLWPMWLRSPASIGIELAPPARGTELDSGASRSKLVVSARFSENFVGPGRYEILDLPDGAALRSVWDGVERKGFALLMPARVLLDLHVRAELGTLRFPFPKGTGFGGLSAQLRSPEPGHAKH